MKIKRLFIFVILIQLPYVLHSQLIKPVLYDFQAGATAGFGKQQPFWLFNNHYGKQSLNLNSGFVTAGLTTQPDSSRLLDYIFGLELAERFDGENSFWFHQAYMGFTYRFLEFRMGKMEESYGNQDNTLSSGSALWSTNTRPMPKIVLGTKGFVTVPFTKGYLELDAQLIHGWFGKERYVKDIYLHHKYVYGRLGGNLPVHFTMGLHHYAMWGGVSPDTVYGKLPSGLKAFWKVFFASGGDSLDPATPVNEQINRLGNHLGSWNYRLDVDLPNVKLAAYYQTIFEDNSGFKKLFNRDGLWGIMIERKNSQTIINKILIELFLTDYQSGGIQFRDNGTVDVDNYFNHYIYLSGWTYFGNTIGNPLITSPVMNDDRSIMIENNRVKAFHFGLEGGISKNITYRTYFTFSKNYGTYGSPFPKPLNNQSFFLELRKSSLKFASIEYVVQLAADHGDMYGNNVGIYASVIKYGILGK